MYRQLFVTAAFTAVCLQANSQTLAKEYKSTSLGNPISSSVFCADPTAIDYKGRLYVYGSNDHQQFIKNKKTGNNSYGDIKSIVVFSTDDMVNWTFHGTIDVAKICSSWNKSPWYRGFGVSWAPSVVWRTTEDGTDEFFLYFCNSSHGIGVLKASSPLGPWKSPLGELMIHRDTPGATPCSAVFDPGVTIDDNGVGWISFGGLDPVDGGNSLNPKNARIAKLKPSMTAIDGKPVRIAAPYHFEANELNVINGKFVYTYCSNWAERKDADWNSYCKEYGVSQPKPGACTMCYMVSDNPMDASSWVYKGVYGEHPGMPSPNNHSHLHKFKGNYYYIYHWGALMKKMKDAGVLDGSCDGFRSICVNKATVSESSQKINSVVIDSVGVSAIGSVNPYQLQEAEMMATSAGISYEDFTNITRNTRISTLGNDASQNMQVKMAEGAWIQVRRVNFGSAGAAKFTVRAKGEGTLELRLSRKVAKPVATIEISSDEMTDFTVDVDPAKIKDQKTVYLVLSSGKGIYFDAWQATEAQTEGIGSVESHNAINRQRYDLSGRRLSDTEQHRGIVIEQYTDENGKKHIRKTF